MPPRSSATNTNSLVNFPSQMQAVAGQADRADRADRTGKTERARSQEPGGTGGRERRIDVGIDVDTRGIGRDLGSCSAHPGNPSNSSRAARAARTVADPPDWNSGSWVMHAPLDD